MNSLSILEVNIEIEESHACLFAGKPKKGEKPEQDI